jgi:ABC-type multidrug transport system fused ATPase/permease subunit
MGLIYTGGLGAMLPILRVLVNGDTVQSWTDHQIANKRLDANLYIAERPVDAPIIKEETHVTVMSVKPGGMASTIGLKPEDQIVEVNQHTKLEEMLAELASPDRTTASIRTKNGGQFSGTLPAIRWYVQLGRRLAYIMPRNAVAAIAAIFFLIMGMGLVGNVFRFFQEYLSDKSAISSVNDIRRDMYDHVLHMPMNFFGSSGTSDVTSRLVQDSQQLQDGFKIILGQSIQEPFKALFAFAFSMYLSWKLTLFIVLFAPVMVIVIRKFGKKMRRASRAMLQRSSHMLGQIESTLIGIRVVKAANAEKFEGDRYSKIMAGLRLEMLKMARYEAYATPAMETITMLCAGAILMYASYLIFMQHSLDQTSFFMVMACLVGIGESLRRLSKLSAVLGRSNAAAARVFEILDIPIEVDRDDAIALKPVEREIRFENVFFKYSAANSNAVEDVSLRVPKGRSVAIVGRNGSGKTTLLALLPRFYDPQLGRILIDDVDISHAAIKSLRNQIGIVTQEAVIFPGTIAENIAYGIPDATRADIESAAKRAFAHDFIMEKADGYDTILGEMGGQLSGGQRQRINIARAILRQTPILILDEATSQVDAESEHLIQQAIESIMHERTTFVIAHRFSTILSADTIVVMDRGQIIGQGEHDELLESCPTYRQLYERQLIGV